MGVQICIECIDDDSGTLLSNTRATQGAAVALSQRNDASSTLSLPPSIGLRPDPAAAEAVPRAPPEESGEVAAPTVDVAPQQQQQAQQQQQQPLTTDQHRRVASVTSSGASAVQDRRRLTFTSTASSNPLSLLTAASHDRNQRLSFAFDAPLMAMADPTQTTDRGGAAELRLLGSSERRLRPRLGPDSEALASLSACPSLVAVASSKMVVTNVPSSCGSDLAAVQRRRVVTTRASMTEEEDGMATDGAHAENDCADEVDGDGGQWIGVEKNVHSLQSGFALACSAESGWTVGGDAEAESVTSPRCAGEGGVNASDWHLPRFQGPSPPPPRVLR